MAQKSGPSKLGVKLRRPEDQPAVQPKGKRGGLSSASAKAQTAAATNRAKRQEEMALVKEQEAGRQQYYKARRRKAAPAFTDPTTGKIRVQIDAKTSMWVLPGANIDRIKKTYENRVKQEMVRVDVSCVGRPYVFLREKFLTEDEIRMNEVDVQAVFESAIASSPQAVTAGKGEEDLPF
jgi:hypothetical protein